MSKRLLFAAVADDDTGATDLAGMLAEQHLRPLLWIDAPDASTLERHAADADAVILAAGTRAMNPQDAYRKTRDGVRLMRRLDPRVLQIKYCSTFDSTREGNIGPAIDAALDETGESFTMALPALPVNGRTTYQGYHFVHDRLLSDSPMRHHPLTPMTNPDLVSHLQAQTRRRVGLAAYPTLRALGEKFDSLRADGVEIAVIDCIQQSDLATIAAAIRDLRVITGSSAAAMALPAEWARAGYCQPAPGGADRPAHAVTGRGTLIVAGSCSLATRAQNAWAETHGIRSAVLDGAELVASAVPTSLEERVAEQLARGGTFLLRTPAQADDLDPLQIAHALACLVQRVVQRARPAGLILAGGETSGAVTRALGLGALRVGRNIEPGVPRCQSIGDGAMNVVLKSGNFGSPDFYHRAMKAIS